MPILLILGAITLTLSGVFLRLSGIHLDPLTAALLYGLALGTAALSALVASKVNQWTLLVGNIPLVFNIASYVIGKPVPASLLLDDVQRTDVLLTSAQSLFAVAILLRLHLSLREAGLLLGLFLVQFVFPDTHTAITIVYIVLSLFFFMRNRSQIATAVRSLLGGSRVAPVGN